MAIFEIVIAKSSFGIELLSLSYEFFDNKKNVSKAINIFIQNLNSFKKDINSKNNKSILKKLIQTKKVRSKIIKLKQDVNKPDFGRD